MLVQHEFFGNVMIELKFDDTLERVCVQSIKWFEKYKNSKFSHEDDDFYGKVKEALRAYAFFKVCDAVDICNFILHNHLGYNNNCYTQISVRRKDDRYNGKVTAVSYTVNRNKSFAVNVSDFDTVYEYDDMDTHHLDVVTWEYCDPSVELVHVSGYYFRQENPPSWVEFCDDCQEWVRTSGHFAPVYLYDYENECWIDKPVRKCRYHLGEARYCAYHDRYEIHSGQTYDDIWVCDDSPEPYHYECEQCGASWYGYDDDSRAFSYSGRFHSYDCLCEDCYYGLMELKSDNLHSYSYKPTTHFYYDEDTYRSTDRGELHLGFELELNGAYDLCDVNEYCDEVADRFDGLFYMKQDCSIGEYGVETVSHPATPEYWLRKFKWNTLISIADNAGLGNEEQECGFHVHVNRSYFNDDELASAKLSIIFNRFYNFLRKLGDRGLDQADEWARPICDEFVSDDFKDDKWHDKVNYAKGTRYHAVNLCNTHTIEFRLFSATTSIERLTCMLDVIQAVCRIANEMDVESILAMDLENFKAQLHNRAYTAMALV